MISEVLIVLLIGEYTEFPAWLPADPGSGIALFNSTEGAVPFANTVRYACSDARPFECQTDIDGRLQDLRQIVPVRWAIIGKSECEKRFAGILPVHLHENTMFE